MGAQMTEQATIWHTVVFKSLCAFIGFGGQFVDGFSFTSTFLTLSCLIVPAPGTWTGVTFGTVFGIIIDMIANASTPGLPAFDN
jgi:hypothetical protein